jgi:transposase InsO family protein
MIDIIKATAIISDDSYGRRRHHATLLAHGFKLSVSKAANLMLEANVETKKPSRKHYYPKAGKAHLIADNHLDRAFEQPCINTHWVGDITYIRTHQGWSYLACVLDLASKEVVGFALSKSPNAQLAKDALNHALHKQRPDTTKLLFHSDQGVQYSAKLFVNHLAILKIKQSMSRRGNCWDNSVMERFFRSLKSERLNHLTFINHDAVCHTVESYLHFYNYRRLHSTLGYITPAQKMARLKKAA